METHSSALICLHWAALVDSDWLSGRTWTWTSLTGRSIFCPEVEEVVSLPAHLSIQEGLSFFLTPVFMIIYDNEKCAYLCTVCVNSVPKCTVNSIFIFFFNLKKKQSECHDHFTRLKMTLGCFFASCLSNSSLWANCAQISITLIKGNSD